MSKFTTWYAHPHNFRATLVQTNTLEELQTLIDHNIRLFDCHSDLAEDVIQQRFKLRKQQQT